MPTSSDIPAINIQNLSKSYRLYNKKGNKIKALDNVSLKINQGEVIGIIGPNGSGKSTLLKVLSEITAPDSGKVKIHGKVASILEVGTGFNPDLSGRKNIYLNARLHGMKKKEVDGKFDDIVDLFGFRRFLDTPVKQYSSGMYMRLAFAVVVHIDADIYLFDEVLSVGDIKFQKTSLIHISKLREKGKTICIVTHAPNIIADFVDSFSLLIKGNLTKTGYPNEVLYEYKKTINLTSLPKRQGARIFPSDLKNKKRVFNNSFGDLNITDAYVKENHKITSKIRSQHQFMVFIFLKTNIIEPVTIKIYIKNKKSDHIILDTWGKTKLFNADRLYECKFIFSDKIINDIQGEIGVTFLINDEIIIYYPNILNIYTIKDKHQNKSLGYFSINVKSEINEK